MTLELIYGRRDCNSVSFICVMLANLSVSSFAFYGDLQCTCDVNLQIHHTTWSNGIPLLQDLKRFFIPDLKCDILQLSFANVYTRPQNRSFHIESKMLQNISLYFIIRLNRLNGLEFNRPALTDIKPRSKYFLPEFAFKLAGGKVKFKLVWVTGVVVQCT